MAAFDRIPGDDWQQLAAVLDARIDELSAEQQIVAVERASRRIDAGDIDVEDEAHLRVVWDELRIVALHALLDRLVASGALEVAGVAGSGQLLLRRPTRDPS